MLALSVLVAGCGSGDVALEGTWQQVAYKVLGAAPQQDDEHVVHSVIQVRFLDHVAFETTYQGDGAVTTVVGTWSRKAPGPTGPSDTSLERRPKRDPVKMTLALRLGMIDGKPVSPRAREAETEAFLTESRVLLFPAGVDRTTERFVGLTECIPSGARRPSATRDNILYLYFVAMGLLSLTVGFTRLCRTLQLSSQASVPIQIGLGTLSLAVLGRWLSTAMSADGGSWKVSGVLTGAFAGLSAVLGFLSAMRICFREVRERKGRVREGPPPS